METSGTAVWDNVRRQVAELKTQSALLDAMQEKQVTVADLPATVEALRPESRIVALGKAVW